MTLYNDILGEAERSRRRTQPMGNRAGQVGVVSEVRVDVDRVEVPGDLAVRLVAGAVKVWGTPTVVSVYSLAIGIAWP